MSPIRRSFLFSALDKYVTQILIIVTTAIMARLLTPAETGVYLVAISVIVLVDNFRSFGVGVYIVQTPELRPNLVRSAFTLTFLLSAAMGLTIFLVADGLAGFYGDPTLAGLLRIAALGFLVVPFGTPAISLLQRDMAFRQLAIANVAAAAANAIVTIGLAVAGYGPVSYVWGFIASGVVLTLVALAQRPETWIFRPCLTGMGQVVSFGMVSSAVVGINMIGDMLPRLIFGRLLGFDAVALYGRATTICHLPERMLVQALQPVVLPAMAAHMRGGGDLGQGYLRGHVMMSAFQWPALALLALLADPVVRLLLGPQWMASVPLVQVMALATMALAPAFMTFPVLVAAGRIRDTLWSTLIAVPPSLLVVSCAAAISLDAVAASLLVTAPFQMAVSLFFVRRAIGVSIRELVARSLPNVAITGGTILLPSVIVSLSPEGFALTWPHAALAIFGGGVGWLAAAWAVGHPVVTEIRDAFRLIARIVPRRTPAPPAIAGEGS